MHKGQLVLGGIIGATLLSGAILLSINTYADDDTDSVDQINITIPDSCSVEGIIATGGEHTKTVQNNQYYSEIGTTTFKTYCNDDNGYAIYAIGYSNDEFGNTLMKHDSSSAYDFDTGTATSGNTSNWAMMLTAAPGTYVPTIHSDTNGAFTSYHVIPSTYTKVVSFASNTDLPATGVNAVGSGFTSTYASWISATQVAGTYTGKVKYTLVHPVSDTPIQPQIAETGCINYFVNIKGATGTMGCQPVSASDTTATLFASNYSKAGYGFAGWSSVFDYETNPNANFYGPNEDITFEAGQYTGSNNGLSLYAVWVKSVGTLQNSSDTTSTCNSLVAASDNGARTLDSVSALTDSRDNQTYAIAKLADGKCWFMENLRLDNTAELTTTNTHFPLNDNDPTNPTVTLKHNFSDTITYNTLSASSSVAYNENTTPDGWCNSSTSECIDQSRLRTDNTANRITYATNDTAMSNSNVNLYSYGNYYNWYSATAGRGTYSKSGGSASGDICPKNWFLPKTYTGGEYDALKAVTSNMRTYPNNFIYSGYGGITLNSRGSTGYYWSATASSSSFANAWTFTSDFYGTAVTSKYLGYPVRCFTSPSA